MKAGCRRKYSASSRGLNWPRRSAKPEARTTSRSERPLVWNAVGTRHAASNSRSRPSANTGGGPLNLVSPHRRGARSPARKGEDALQHGARRVAPAQQETGRMRPTGFLELAAVRRTRRRGSIHRPFAARDSTAKRDRLIGHSPAGQFLLWRPADGSAMHCSSVHGSILAV